MGFFDKMGDLAGKALGAAVAKTQDIQRYIPEYETMSDIELMEEFDDLRNRRGSEIENNRRLAVSNILSKRGYKYHNGHFY